MIHSSTADVFAGIVCNRRYRLPPSSSTDPDRATCRDFGFIVTDGTLIAGDGSNWIVRTAVDEFIVSV